MSNISQRSRQRSRQQYRVAISQALLQQIREPRLEHRNGVGSRIRTEFEATMTIRISISNSFRVRAYAGDSNSDFEFVPGTTRATNPECVPNLGDDFRTNSYRMPRHIG
ncbi:hypothetical protein Fcan01_22805 [Folsomia candida]|uniref:Uncharacterized protein n=1 Tax=Folsomia candida TaxID=158441 RepID=A0A226DDJ2_FOLCA|nr:hypothetical protein Fcan01_22805 [Folsomia candida]